IAFLFVLPWLDRCPVRSIRYRGLVYKVWLAIFVVSFVCLGYLGAHVPTAGRTLAAQLFSTLYFAFFILMPIYTRFERTTAVPERVT
ncbi:MAG: cytochrome b, partial [Pseudomonadota bacterium]